MFDGVLTGLTVKCRVAFGCLLLAQLHYLFYMPWYVVEKIRVVDFFLHCTSNVIFGGQKVQINNERANAKNLVNVICQFR